MKNRVAEKRNDISIESVENVNKIKQYKDSAEENQNDRIENPQKFEHYFKFRGMVSDLQSHQILAINRGESLGVGYALCGMNLIRFYNFFLFSSI